MCSASKIVTSWPAWIRYPAQISPPGPEPQTATFLPVFFGVGGSGDSPWLASQSATKRSRRPIATDSCFLATTHCFSHCSSCGQTRPQTAGSRFVVLIDATALA